MTALTTKVAKYLEEQRGKERDCFAFRLLRECRNELVRLEAEAVQSGDKWQSAVERYGRELDESATLLEAVHPIGKIKGIGRMEVVVALRQVIDNKTLSKEPQL